MLAKGWVRMRATVGLLIGVFLFAYGCSGDTTAKKMAFVQRGDAYFADGKYAEAILEFKNAIQLDPQDAQAHYKLGLALLKRGSGPADLQEAFHSISKSVKFDATNLEAQLKLGEFFLLSRKFDKAQEKAELILEREPNNLAAHLLLGHAYGGQQQLDKAIAAFQTALTLDPKRLQTYFYLGTQYQLHKEPKAAEQTYRKALQIDPDATPTYLALGAFYAAQGQAVKAEESYKQAIALQPKNIPLRLQLANFYASANKRKEAEATYKEATSGAWQKYPHRWRHGIIGAKKSPVLPKGVSYAHRHGASPHDRPQGGAHSTTTGLLGAACAPADESPATGTARQDSFSTGDGSQSVPRDAPDASQSRDGTHMAPAMAGSGSQAGADGS